MSAQAVFTSGSTMRHVLVMTSASAMGLLTMFGVDMVDMYFLTLLGEQELAAFTPHLHRVLRTVIHETFSTSELATLRRLLRRLVAAADAAVEDPR